VRPADSLDDEQAGLRHVHVLDDGVALRQHQLRTGEIEMPTPGDALQGDFQHLAPRRPGTRVEVERIPGTEHGVDDLVAEMREPQPATAGSAQVLLELVAVAVLNRRQDIAAVQAAPEADLAEAREIVADLIAIRRLRGPETVEVNPDISAQILVWAFPFARVPRIEKAATLAVPGHAAAGRAGIDAMDDLRDLHTGVGLIDVHVTLLGPAL
jgi:hypothetical protein